MQRDSKWKSLNIVSDHKDALKNFILIPYFENKNYKYFVFLSDDGGWRDIKLSERNYHNDK